MKQAANRMRWKIRDLRDELHYKAARFLVDQFDLILIPTFETSQMVRREQRKLRSLFGRQLFGLLLEFCEDGRVRGIDCTEIGFASCAIGGAMAPSHCAPPVQL